MRYSMIFALKAYMGERSLRDQFKARHAINDCKVALKKPSVRLRETCWEKTGTLCPFIGVITPGKPLYKVIYRGYNIIYRFFSLLKVIF